MAEIHPIKRTPRLHLATHKPTPQQTPKECERHDDVTAVTEIEDCCAALFDHWCETRHVVALAYLMYAWPAPEWSAHRAHRISLALRELRRLHTDSLDPLEHQLIRRALNAVESAFRF